MNTTELVREVERAQPRSTSTRRPTPLFHSELIGPARHAILRGRQLLLSEQLETGAWLGTQTGDASLPSQLVLWLAYLGQEQCELAQQAAATILDQLLAGGGWSLAPGGRPDVSTSVQAYFALKLTGLDPSDERLSRARRVIRRLGGADAADAATRFFLALLGQVDYGCCAAMPPESLLLDGRRPRWRVPLSIVWSHRAVRDVGIERGVRELFVDKPCDWPMHATRLESGRGARFSAMLRSLLESAIRQCERRGWTPLRGRGLERAEAQLLDQMKPARIVQLDFFELLWHAIAIRTIGYPDDSLELRTCETTMREMISRDDHSGRASPRLRTSSITDTLLMLRALRASGISQNHPAVLDAVAWLSQSRRLRLPYEVADVANLFLLLGDASDSGDDIHDTLLPDIEVSRGDWADDEAIRRSKRHLQGIERIAARFRQQLLAQLHRAPNLTGAIVEAVATADGETATLEVQRAVERLRAAQRADGRWDGDSGPIHATSLAVRGLAAAGMPAGDEAVAAGAHWLIVHQQQNGGWGEAAASFAYGAQSSETESSNHEPQTSSVCRPTASHTGFALLALVAAGRANHAAAPRAVHFLVETQADDGGWREPHFVARDAATGRLCGNDLHSAAWPLLALSRWAVAATADQQGAADASSLRLVNASADS